ncbi:hypothetical protein [Salinisphaera sp. T31B1]|uniref:hypothetical protein n=1 Tax=Salinisphaera sp. T31B1 TaxID=727963 RepID=UPI00333EC7FE
MIDAPVTITVGDINYRRAACRQVNRLFVEAYVVGPGMAAMIVMTEVRLPGCTRTIGAVRYVVGRLAGDRLLIARRPVQMARPGLRAQRDQAH